MTALEPSREPLFAEPLHVGRPNIGSQQTFQRYVDGIFERRWLSNAGPLVEQFEQRVAEYLCVEHCIAMCNGTIALEIAIRALGLQGEVIVPSYTFIATAHALRWLGLTPVFADIDPVTHNLDPESVRRAITPRTTGILAVHLWGRGAPVAELQQIADDHRLALFFDAAHAFGCSIGGRKIGNFGALEVLSFHATKFFNTFEGGAIVTNDAGVADRARRMRNFGFASFDNVVSDGTNGKMVEVCAAMGLTNLDAIGNVVAVNRANYLRYRASLAAIPGVALLPFDEAQSNNYQYVVVELLPEFPNSRDAVIDALHAENVLARRYFWPGCHRMQPYRDLYPDAGRFLPNTTIVADRVIVLPTGTTLPAHAIEQIVAIISRCAVGQ